MDWNFDISAAPLGHTETQTRKGPKDTSVSIEVHVPAFIIALGACGTVTRSRWLPVSGRWEMFTAHNPPVAWDIWPVAPDNLAELLAGMA